MKMSSIQYRSCTTERDGPGGFEPTTSTTLSTICHVLLMERSPCPNSTRSAIFLAWAAVFYCTVKL